MIPPGRTERFLQVAGAALAGLAALLLTLLYAEFPLPFDHAVAACLPQDCFNERLRVEPILQPSATYSSLAFAVAGGYLLATSAIMRRSGVGHRATGFFLTSLGAVSFIVGLGSAVYHARFTFLGQTLDVLGMNLIAFQLLIFSLVAKGTLSLRNGRRVLVSLGAASVVFLVVLPQYRRTMFAAFLGVALTIEIVRLGGISRLLHSKLGLGLGIFLLGYVFWILDDVGIWFSATSPLQGHSVWHVVGAVAVVLLAEHERSESTSLRYA